MKQTIYVNDQKVAEVEGEVTIRLTQEQAVPEGVVNFNDHTIGSYRDDQDTPGGTSVEDGGATLRITGNHWKQIDFAYAVTESTVLEFDFASDQQGEIHGIALDDNLDHKDVKRGFQVYGTDPWAWGYDYRQGPGHYVIPVGQHYTGSMNYLAFVNDHDVASPNVESVFSNVRLYEGEAPPPPPPPPPPQVNFPITEADLSYLGQVRVPGPSTDPDFRFGHRGLTRSLVTVWLPQSRTLLLQGKIGGVAELTNFVPGGTAEFASPDPGWYLWGPYKNKDLYWDGSNVENGDACLVDGRIVWGLTKFYNVANDDRPFAGSTDVETREAEGLSLVSGAPLCAGGRYCCAVPEEWREQLRGSILCGSGGRVWCGTQWGPFLVAYDFSSPPPIQYEGTVLWKCDSQRTVDPWIPASTPAGQAACNACEWITTSDGRDAVVVAGWVGLPPHWYGQPDAGPNGERDPCSNSKGCHSASYAHMLWFLDPAQLAEVAAGTRHRREVDAYPWRLDEVIASSPCAAIAGLSYDRESRRLYVTQDNADKDYSPYETLPLIHIFEVQ